MNSLKFLIWMWRVARAKCLKVKSFWVNRRRLTTPRKTNEKLSTDNPDTAPCPDTVQCPDPDERLPDGERLIGLSAPVTEGEGPVHEIPAEKFPKTLSECLVSGNLWPHLWQLLVWLRCGSEGMDSEYLKKAEVVRRRAEKMNWFQTLCKTLQNHPAFLCTKPGLGFFDLLMFWHQSLSH